MALMWPPPPARSCAAIHLPRYSGNVRLAVLCTAGEEKKVSITAKSDLIGMSVASVLPNLVNLKRVNTKLIKKPCAVLGKNQYIWA